MLQVRKMGSFSKIIKMLPGMNEMKDQIDQIDDKELDRVVAIINGMTPAERDDPKIINGSRRARIAKGSGVEVAEINQLVDRFFEARKVMKQMAGGLGGMKGMLGNMGGAGMGGMPGLGGGGKKSRGKAQQVTRPPKGKGKRASGNPAKRAQEQAAADARAAAGGEPNFEELRASNFELPAEFKGLLPPDEK